jgi:hypothetical protein
VLKAHDLYFSQAIIWDKQHPVLTRKDFMGAHEWCFYGCKLGAAHQFFGPPNATGLWGCPVSPMRSPVPSMSHSWKKRFEQPHTAYRLTPSEFRSLVPQFASFPLLPIRRSRLDYANDPESDQSTRFCREISAPMC